MTTRVQRCFACLFAISFLLVGSANGEIEIVLQNDFIHEYKDKATIDVNYVVDKAHAHPNPATKDGDMHVAGRAEEVKLPIVAEIMNAKDEKETVDLIHEIEGTGKKVSMSGAWRLWCEHGGNNRQVQGEPLQAFNTTNPAHVFEIHPITEVKGKSLLDSLREIKGYEPKDAEAAFTKYENIPCQIEPSDHDTTITTNMAGYNYVEFAMKPSAKERVVEDGRFVMAQVCDLEGELLVRNRRMVFIKDSEPEKKTRNASGSKLFHVLGIPRIDLALVEWRCKEAASTGGNKEVLKWGLPYEIIIVGYYGEVRDEDEEATNTANRASGPERSTAARFIPREVHSDHKRNGLFEHASEQP